MGKDITFFRNRQQTGYTYEFEIEDSARIYRILVYSRKPLEEALVHSRRLRGVSIEVEVDKITQLLLRGGGVIALTYEDKMARMLAVIPALSGGKVPFGNVGLLLPGHPSLRLEPLNQKGIDFPLGSKALVPVDKEAEDSLRGLQKYVGFLPPDLEALVLHALRDPSLEFRIGRLEAMVLKGTAGSGGVPIPRVAPWYKRWLKQPALVWPVAAIALGLMLIVNFAFLYPNLQYFDGSIVLPFRGDRGQISVTSSTPEQKIFAVVQAVRGKRSNPHFAALSQGHFAKVQKEGDLTKILTHGDVNGPLVVRGLLKLEALRQDSSLAENFFKVAGNPSVVNTFYKGRELDTDSREMLAALSCAVFLSPGLPQTQWVAAIPFADVGQECASFPLEKAAPGLDRLLKLVEEMK